MYAFFNKKLANLKRTSYICLVVNKVGAQIINEYTD